jgi:acyl-CoA thioesterase
MVRAMDLSSALEVQRLDDRRYAAEIPTGWQQGRGAFGGLVLGTIVRAVESAAGGPDRALRTLTAEICGPVQTGAAEVALEVLRAGSGTTTVAARLLQGGEVQAHCVCVLARARGGETDLVGVPRPAMPPWRDAPAVPPGMLAPDFSQNFEYRPTGPLPFAGGADAVAEGWIRARDPVPARDTAHLVAHVDAYWPALFARLTGFRPMATITFSLDVLGTCEGLDPTAPLFHQGRVLAARDGYAAEERILWGEDGRLLAINRQTFVVIR